MVLSGIFDEIPDLKVVLATSRGTAFLKERKDNRMASSKSQAEAKDVPSYNFGATFFTTWAMHMSRLPMRKALWAIDSILLVRLSF
jgi:hypothetical protein